MRYNVITRWLLPLCCIFFNISLHAQESQPFSILKTSRIHGIIPDINDAYGVVFRDLNNDGNPDLYFACFRNLNRLLINNGGLIPFVDRTIASGTGGYLMTSGFTNLELGAACADYDNDGRADLFLAGWGKTHRLFHNSGDVRFEDATKNLNAWGKLDANQGLWLDADSDGFLDLFVTDEHHSNRLFHNQRNGYFEEVIWTEEFLGQAVSQGAAASDADLDGDMDIYVCNWFEPDYLLINNGDGVFARATLPLTTLTDSVSTNSATFADSDNDGDMDLFVAGDNGRIYYYENDSRDSVLTFIEHTDLPFSDTGNRVFGLLLEDFNLDGWLDILITMKGMNRLYFFDPAAKAFPDAFDTDYTEAYSTGSAAADLDRDGDLDLVISNKDENSEFYLNTLNADHYLILNLKGVRSNHDAIGAKVFFYSTGGEERELLGLREVSAQSAYLSSSDPRIYFGTKGHERLFARIIFPGGEVIEKDRLVPGREYTVYEHKWVLNAYYSAISSARILANRPDFWYNLLLSLLIIINISAHVGLGQRRYSWSSLNASMQLFMWFLLIFFLFLFLRDSSTTLVLQVIAGLALFGSALSVFYNEHFLRQRRKRERIRRLLQDLSERILQIHNNQELAADTVQTVTRHPDVRKAAVYFKTDEQQLELVHASSANGLPAKIEATFEQGDFQLNQEQSFSEALNVHIPIHRKQTLMGLLALNMQHAERAVNREDFRQIQSIAAQMAVAIENNDYIEKTSRLVEQLTATRVREEYVEQLEKTNQQLDTKNRELQRLFRELQDKEAQLVHSEKMASLGQLVAGISHELNNPISFIYSNMRVLSDYVREIEELLQDEKHSKDAAALRELLEDIYSTIEDSVKGSKAVKEIVQNLKSFSRIDQAEWKESTLDEILDTCLKILKPHIPDRIKVSIKLKDNPVLFCNPGQLNQVFINLLINAVQAIEGEGQIGVSSEQQKNDLVINVKDSGGGISEENKSRIFDPFFTTKPVSKGTGLGLSISYSIIEKHNGSMEVDSSPGEGTTFTIRLPLNPQLVVGNEPKA